MPLPPQSLALPCTHLGSLCLCQGGQTEGLQGLHQQPGEAASHRGWLQAYQTAEDYMLAPQACPHPGSEEASQRLGTQICQDLQKEEGAQGPTTQLLVRLLLAPRNSHSDPLPPYPPNLHTSCSLTPPHALPLTPPPHTFTSTQHPSLHTAALSTPFPQDTPTSTPSCWGGRSSLVLWRVPLLSPYSPGLTQVSLLRPL